MPTDASPPSSLVDTKPLAEALERFVTSPDQRDKQDRSIRGYKKLMKTHPDLARQETDLIIKNTYRTLMTRGMKGCYVYCTDAETADYFRAGLAAGSL